MKIRVAPATLTLAAPALAQDTNRDMDALHADMLAQAMDAYDGDTRVTALHQRAVAEGWFTGTFEEFLPLYLQTGGFSPAVPAHYGPWIDPAEGAPCVPGADQTGWHFGYFAGEYQPSPGVVTEWEDADGIRYEYRYLDGCYYAGAAQWHSTRRKEKRPGDCSGAFVTRPSWSRQCTTASCGLTRFDPATRLPTISPSGPTVTGTVSPSFTSPASSISASWSCKARWITRLSGRAP